MDRYVVIGNPIAHSLSPDIHAGFAREMGERISYERMLVPPGAFAAHANRFFKEGGLGANVTLPFKLDALRFADRASERAALAGAANFLAKKSGRIEADNTDGLGLIADLTRNLGLKVRGTRILLLGAGGAARGVLAPLLAESPSRLVIANRTPERARDLVQHFASRGPVEGTALDRIPDDRFDLVLNATSASTRGEPLVLPDHALTSGAFAYDMAYGPAGRGFLERARARGMQASDGLGMLVEQAAESFHLWRGRRPQTRAVLAELRARVA